MSSTQLRLLCAALAAGVILPACTGASDTVGDGYVDGECHPTITENEFTPPEPYVPSRQAKELVWYGTNELWTVLDMDGDHSPRKSVWWSENFPGGAVEESPEIVVTWTRLDTNAEVVTVPNGTNAHTDQDGWFMIGGIDPDIPGCWEVTAIYKGASMSYDYERT